MNNRKYLFIFLTTLLFFILSLKTIFACSCVQLSSPRQALKESDAVLIGKVTSIEPMDNNYLDVSLQTSVSWKGWTGDIMNVKTHSEGVPCGFDFKVGEVYLVYANRLDDGSLHVSLCSRTKRSSYEQAILDELKELGRGEPADIPEEYIKAVDNFIINRVGQDFFKTHYTYLGSTYESQRYTEEPISFPEPTPPKYIEGYFLEYQFKFNDLKDELIEIFVDLNGKVYDKDVKIPDCIENPNECSYQITKEKAIQIAKETGLKDGIKEWKTDFHWYYGEIQ